MELGLLVGVTAALALALELARLRVRTVVPSCPTVQYRPWCRAPAMSCAARSCTPPPWSRAHARGAGHAPRQPTCAACTRRTHHRRVLEALAPSAAAGPCSEARAESLPAADEFPSGLSSRVRSKSLTLCGTKPIPLFLRLRKSNPLFLSFENRIPYFMGVSPARTAKQMPYFRFPQPAVLPSLLASCFLLVPTLSDCYCYCLLLVPRHSANL